MKARERPGAILFDLDDTLLDDSGDTDRLWREVTEEAALRLDGVGGDTLHGAIETVRTWYWSDPDRHREGRQDLRAATQRIVAEALDTLGAEPGDVAAWIAHEYRDRRDAAIRLFPGAVETLERIRAEGIRTALLTNGSSAHQRLKIERFDLARHFDLILIEGEVGRGKPHPSVYETALRGLSTSPAETWMVGDNIEWDVAAPQRLGIFGIWIDRHGRGVPASGPYAPDRIIRHIGEL